MTNKQTGDFIYSVVVAVYSVCNQSDDDDVSYVVPAKAIEQGIAALVQSV
jgi:hypothetical protein